MAAVQYKPWRTPRRGLHLWQQFITSHGEGLHLWQQLNTSHGENFCGVPFLFPIQSVYLYNYSGMCLKCIHELTLIVIVIVTYRFLGSFPTTTCIYLVEVIPMFPQQETSHQCTPHMEKLYPDMDGILVCICTVVTML